ncbi:MAG: hypothetical protein ACYC5K_02410 [Saccharofermentanales bacterium]
MTDPARVYAEIRRSITDEFIYRVSGVLIEHQGVEHAIPKPEIAGILGFTEYTDSVKRKIELAIAKLCELHFPVMATSNKVGYYMPVSEADYEAWKDEHLSRLEREREKLALIERLRLRYLAGDVPRVPEVARQRELWG